MPEVVIQLAGEDAETFEDWTAGVALVCACVALCVSDNRLANKSDKTPPEPSADSKDCKTFAAEKDELTAGGAIVELGVDMMTPFLRQFDRW